MYAYMCVCEYLYIMNFKKESKLCSTSMLKGFG